MRAILYCRVSSDHQREMGTIESQRDALIAYANAQGWAKDRRINHDRTHRVA